MSKIARAQSRSRLSLALGMIAAVCGTSVPVGAQCPDPLPDPIQPASCGAGTAFPKRLSSNTTGASNAAYLGAPDDSYHGLGGRAVVWDFEAIAIVDKPGKDFSIYELESGSAEFNLMSVAVSEDGQLFVNVKATEGALVRIPGDQAIGSASFGRSYDLAGSGLSSVRYVRVTGSSGGVPTQQTGFDLDAAGAINFNADIDGDGLTVCQETTYGTNPFSADTDGDEVTDAAELNCGTDPLEADSDADEVPDGADVCLGDDRLDADADGVPDACDQCLGNDAAGDTDADGVCEDVDLCLGNDAMQDSDGDGTCNDIDVCPLDAHDDVDGDGACGDVDLCVGDDRAGDDDSDQICNDRDLCRGNDASGDSDADLVCDSDDNCPVDTNPDQADADADGIGNRCENDDDVDGVVSDSDNCPALYNPGQQDLDGDGAGDACDGDDDGDGISDGQDNCLIQVNPNQADFDRDGLGDVCDGDGVGDSDADAVADTLDLCPGTETGVWVDEHGCSGAQVVTLNCGEKPEHHGRGQYAACVVLHSTLAQRKGLLSENERALMIRNATRKLFNPWHWRQTIMNLFKKRR